MTPNRIQLSRKPGSICPPGTACVDRSSPWGNPWAVICIDGNWYAEDEFQQLGPYEDATTALAVSLRKYERYARAIVAADPDWIEPLTRAETLGCWCALGGDIRCHADILIKLIMEMKKCATESR